MNKIFQTKQILLVEGAEDKRVLPFLVEQHTGISWELENTTIVGIKAFDGKPELLKPGVIETQLKSPGLITLGVLVDADEDATACWDSIRHRERLKSMYPTFPMTMSEKGFITRADNQPTFGVWIMPDNINRGMLETFLLHLRPTSALLEFSKEVVKTAQERGAPVLETHTDKAQIHTWLAWQNPPGQQMHSAIQQKMLTEKSGLLVDFLTWFCELYQLQPINYLALQGSDSAS
jgi:hypothetical protein